MKFDDPNFGPIVLAAVAALLVALAVFGLLDMDDTKTNDPQGLTPVVHLFGEEVS